VLPYDLLPHVVTLGAAHKGNWLQPATQAQRAQGTGFKVGAVVAARGVRNVEYLCSRSILELVVAPVVCVSIAIQFRHYFLLYV